LIISNDKLRQQCGNMPFRQAFAKADDILATAAKCITDVITTTGQINVDFADVCTVMKNGGVAILGSATASGENRAHIAVEQALNSPLLNDNDISGAKWILLNINSAEGEFEHTMDEAEAIQAFVQQQAGDYCDVILGMGNDPNLGDKISVTVIATGFNHKEIDLKFSEKKAEETKSIVNLRQQEQNTTTTTTTTEASTTDSPVAALDPFAPTLKEANTTDAKDDIVSNIINNVWERNLPLLNNNSPEAKTEVEQTSATSDIQMHVTESAFISEEKPTTRTISERFLTEHELEEKQRFEEQKRQLEERAERLRNLSFNIKPSDPVDMADIENVPAYLRKEMSLEKGINSADSYYSGYTVGFKNEQEDNQVSINTINTFLDGKKPD